MTQPWGSHTRSANGAKKRTDHKALGPSRVVPALWRTGAASLLSYPSKNGRLWLGIQSGYTSVSATRYRCYDPSGGGCGAPPSLTADTLNPDRIVYVEASDDGKWFTTIIDNDEQYIPSPSHEDLGLYVYEAMGATTACCARLYIQTAGDFAESVQIPHDTSDDVKAKADDLVGRQKAGKPYKTVIIVTGASLKGMGAAGVAMPDELRRTAALIAEAKRQGLTIIGAHVEGMARRAQGAAPGDNSDEQSIDAVMPLAHFMIVRQDGNEDKRFTVISDSKKIPLILFEKNMELKDVLKNLFGK